MTEPCPVCDNKLSLDAMGYTPEIIEEMARQDKITDFCGNVELLRRLDICYNCDKLVDDMTCSSCGCFVRLRARHTSSHCANGKW